MLLSVVAEAHVEAADQGGDCQEEHTNSLWVALPVNDWIHLTFKVEESKVVREHIEEPVPGHQFPVSCEQLDVGVVDVGPGHKQWCCMQNGPVDKCEVGLGVPRGRTWQVVDIENDHWHQDDPEAEGDSQVQAVGHLEPGIRHHVPVFGVVGCE